MVEGEKKRKMKKGRKRKKRRRKEEKGEEIGREGKRRRLFEAVILGWHEGHLGEKAGVHFSTHLHF